MAKKTRLLL